MSAITRRALPTLPRFCPLLLLACLLAHAGEAAADCIPSKHGAQNIYFSFPQTHIYVPYRSPIGTVLATSAISSGDQFVSLNCTPGNYPVLGIVRARGTEDRLQSGLHNFLNTGIGFRLVDKRSKRATRASNEIISLDSQTAFEVPADDFYLEIVQTAENITLRKLPAQDLYHIKVAGWDTMRFRLINMLTFPARTCVSSASNSQSVNLGTLQLRHLTGINSSPPTPAPVSFRLRLDCRDYLGHVSVSISDAYNQANVTNALSLDRSALSATGVGVQILFRDTPVNFGPDPGARGGIRKLYAFASAGSEHYASERAVEFKARYVQTATTVRPGVVRARATVTFYYP